MPQPLFDRPRDPRPRRGAAGPPMGRAGRAAALLAAIARQAWGFLTSLGLVACLMLAGLCATGVGPEPPPRARAPAVLRSGGAAVVALAWSPDGRTLAAG